MTRFKTKVISVLFVLVLCLAPKAYAIFGVGDLVFDPAALVESIRQTLQMIQTVETLRLQYQHMIDMAKGLPHLLSSRYAAIGTPWISDWPLSDLYELNSTWERAAHGSLEFKEGYQQVTEALDPEGFQFDKHLGEKEAGRQKRRYAGLELQDNANIHALHLTGRVTLHSSQTETQISNLEQDVFSPDPALHTDEAEAQKNNISNLIVVHQLSDTNQLLTALVQQDLVNSRSRREAEAQEMNRHIEYLRRAPEVQRSLSGTITETLKSFRMP